MHSYNPSGIPSLRRWPGPLTADTSYAPAFTILRRPSSTATLFLMDEQFQTVRDLFELHRTYWQYAQRDAGRLADWSVIPPEVALPRAR